MITFYYSISNFVVTLSVAFFRHNLIVPLLFAGTPVGTNTDEGAILEPHQMAVDCQDLRRLHCLTEAMLGGTAPAAVGAPTESMPYTLPAVGRDNTKCPACHQVFKTAHRMRWHMDVHKGMGYPCSKCHKSLSSKKMLRQHEQACKEGKRHGCEVCHKSYASLSILKQHKKVSHAPEHDEVYCCPHCDKEYWVRKSMQEHAGVCEQNPDRKGPYFCRVEGCSRAQHLFQKMKNLNHHLDRAHGWRERQE